MILATQVTGDQRKPTVILLHAIGTDASMWTPQLSALAARYHIVAIDLPGHGKSAVPSGDPGIAGFADDVIETVDALGIGRFALVGVSLGSMVAQRVAARLQDRISALVLSNGIAFAPDPVREIWNARIADAQANGMAATVEGTLARWFTPPFLEAKPTPAPVMAMAATIANTPLDGFLAAARGISTLDNRDCLPLITARTLVLAGDLDTASPPQAVRPIADAVPGARFETLPAGHLMNLEIADAYSTRLLNFLETTQDRPEAGVSA